MELESFADGVVEALLVEPGAKVPVGTVLAPRPRDRRGSRRAAGSSGVAAPARPITPERAGPLAGRGDRRVRSSPAARKLARELGLDLRTLHGSGPHGAIVLRDVERAATSPDGTWRRPTARRRHRRSTAPSGGATAPVAPSRRRSPAQRGTRPPRRRPPSRVARLRIARRDVALEARDPSLLPGAHDQPEARARAGSPTINAHRPIAGPDPARAALLLRAVARRAVGRPRAQWVLDRRRFQPSEEVHLGTAIALRTGGADRAGDPRRR